MSRNADRDLARREIESARKQRIRGTVLTEPRLVDFHGITGATWVVDVDIGRARPLAAVPVKLNSAGSRSYARVGAPVWLERDGGRYQVVAASDRLVRAASVVTLDEDTGDTGDGGSSGVTVVREPFTYYQGGQLPTSFYNPATDGAVRVWLRTYERALGRPSKITVASDVDGSAISAITDQSANANHPAQATAGNRPLYRRFSTTGGNSNKLCTADFDGTDDRLVFPVNVAEASPGAISIFALLNKDAVGSGDDIALELANWRLYSRRAAGDTWGVDQGGGVVDSGSALSTSFVLIEVVASSFGSFSLYQDGILLSTHTPVGAGLGLGASSLGGSATLGPHNGRIAEVIVRDGAVNATQRQAIEAYFRQAMFVAYSRWANGVDGFPKLRVLNSLGQEVTL